MRQLLCSVYDAKAEVWLQPNFFRSKGEAIRTFMDAVNGDSEKSMIARHFEDMSLFIVGMWDEDEGVLYGGDSPTESFGAGLCVTRGIDVKDHSEVIGETTS